MVRETSVDFLRIDLSKGNIRKVITACQNDSIRRTIHFVVVNNGVPLDLSNLFYAEILIQRVDGTEVDNPLIIDGADICYTLKSTDIAVLGENVGHIMLTFNDGSTVETPEFYLNVFNKFYNPAALQSQNDYGTIVQMALDASNSAQDAATSATNALNSANAAASSADDADESADEAKESELAAKGYAEAAEASATSAEASASTATDKAEEAGTYATNALASKNAAATSASNAASSESNAAASATTAIEAASTASDMADAASGSATAAEASATSASTSASLASEKADDASAKANLAKGYKDAAEVAAANAAKDAAEDTAEDLKEYFSTKVTAAQTAASNASASAEAAASSATTASQKATNAATSATDAANSATTASQKATAAISAAAAASQSATTASQKATAASNSASAASGSATTAGQKATSASTSATNANSSADAAAISAAAAAQSAAEAEESARSAAAGGLELGETSNTAYRGDRGKAAYEHSQTTGNPHATTAAQVGADPAGSAAAAYIQAAGYIDQQIAALINGAPQTLDTLKEIADAMAASQTVVEALQEAIGSKAAEVDFTNHANNSTIHITSGERTNWNAAYGKVSEVDALHRQIFAHCTTAAATQTKVITLDDNVTLKNNDILNITFQYTNTYNATSNDHVVFSIGGVTYNVATYQDPSNGNYTYPTGTSWVTYGNAKIVIYYKVDVTNHVLLHLGHSIDANTAWSPQAIGIGYGTCATAAATTAKVVTMANYNLVAHGFVAVKFTYAVPANATMAINGKTAKAIYYKGVAITANVIEAGDVALFVYDGSHYVLLSVDSWLSKINSLTTRVATLEENIGYPIGS